MITSPNTRLTPTDPSVFCWVALVTTAPQPANTSANAAMPSASERRSRPGRSGIDRLERNADDRQPPNQALQREIAHRVLGDPEQLLGRAVAGRLERLRDRRQQLAQGRADDVRLLRVRLDRLAQEPDAVADVARLVVVDFRVAVNEPRQQVVVAQVAGDEAERREAERPLEDLVVDRGEANLRGQVRRRRYELLVRLDQRDVEELTEAVGDLFTRALDMRRNHRRLGDDFVLKARVELHVARLVDLLRR